MADRPTFSANLVPAVIGVGVGLMLHAPDPWSARTAIVTCGFVLALFLLLKLQRWEWKDNKDQRRGEKEQDARDREAVEAAQAAREEAVRAADRAKCDNCAAIVRRDWITSINNNGYRMCLICLKQKQHYPPGTENIPVE